MLLLSRKKYIEILESCEHEEKIAVLAGILLEIRSLLIAGLLKLNGKKFSEKLLNQLQEGLW